MLPHCQFWMCLQKWNGWKNQTLCCTTFWAVNERIDTWCSFEKNISNVCDISSGIISFKQISSTGEHLKMYDKGIPNIATTFCQFIYRAHTHTHTHTHFIWKRPEHDLSGEWLGKVLFFQGIPKNLSLQLCCHTEKQTCTISHFCGQWEKGWLVSLTGPSAMYLLVVRTFF